jgi:hypothetical protein
MTLCLKKRCMSKTSILKTQYDVVQHWLDAADMPSGSNKAHARKIGMSTERMVLKPKYAHLKGAARPRMATFGKVFNVSQGRVTPSRCNHMFPELYAELTTLGNLMRPDFVFENIHVNKNTVSERHVDGGQHGVSMIVGLGNYTGGETVVYEDADDLVGVKHNIYRKPLLFDADTQPHKSLEYEGTRYSIIYFPQNTKNITKKKATPELGDNDVDLGYHVMIVPCNRGRSARVVSSVLAVVKKWQRGHLENVSIFVDTVAEQTEYETALKEAGAAVLRVVATGQTGVQKRRAWAHRHAYKTNTKLINIDDTVDAVVGTTTLQSLAKKGFALCDKHKTRLWGVARENHKDSTDDNVTLSSPIDFSIHGVYAADPTIISCFPPRIARGAINEGNEVSARACVRYGGVVRMGSVTAQSTKALMQDYKTMADQRADKTNGVAALKAHHPSIASMVH